ncbi:MAG: HAMP domain-containing histidine kinase [Pseudomonadales bacterium]|nr:HAMP domain-containing histidine kinase [Pseudomonadales bacterium]
MAYQPRVILVLQDKAFVDQLSLLLESQYSVDVDQYRQLSRGAFVEGRIDLVLLEVRENTFSNITSMVAMLESMESTPAIVLICDDKSIKRAKEFAELGVVAVYPSGFPADLVAMQIDYLLRLGTEINSLKGQLKNARNVAMLSMSASSQLGEVVRFQEKSYEVNDFQKLAEMLTGSVNLLGASCSGVFRVGTLMAERAATIAERNKSWFLKNVSHTFREPMSAILNGVRLMQRRYGNQNIADNREREILSYVEGGANQLADLIEDLLALADAENIRVNKKEFSIKEELEETLDLYQRWSQNKGLNFIAEITDSNVNVYTDPKHFKQVLRSLLSNAVKYTDQGTIALSMEKNGAGHCEYLEVSISDTGKGFDVEKVQPYLKPFVELDEKIIQEGDGAGLGLSVVVQLLNQLDGSLNIESEPGEGSCFTLTLPVFKPEGVEQLLF